MKLVVAAVDVTSDYTFWLTGLPYGDTEAGYTYYVSEEAVTRYQSAKYFKADCEQAMGAPQIGDGGTIYNDQIGYELPSTGGPGIGFLAILGSILALGAGVLLLWRRRQLL